VIPSEELKEENKMLRGELSFELSWRFVSRLSFSPLVLPVLFL